jgi:hypothetical protein
VQASIVPLCTRRSSQGYRWGWQLQRTIRGAASCAGLPSNQHLCGVHPSGCPTRSPTPAGPPVPAGRPPTAGSLMEKRRQGPERTMLVPLEKRRRGPEPTLLVPLEKRRPGPEQTMFVQWVLLRGERLDGAGPVGRQTEQPRARGPDRCERRGSRRALDHSSTRIAPIGHKRHLLSAARQRRVKPRKLMRACPS